MKKILIYLVLAFVLALCLYAPLAHGEAVAADVPAAAPAPAVTVDLTALIVAVCGVAFNFLVALLGKKIVPPLRKWLNEKTNAQQRESLWNVVVTLVDAAEQMIGKGRGEEKLDYVVNKLYQAGYSVDRDMIEAAVKKMNDGMLSAAKTAFDGDGEDDETVGESEPPAEE